MGQFENYEEDFKETRASIDKRISSIPILQGGEKVIEVQKAQQEIQEAETLIKQMSLAVRNIPNNSSFLQKLKSYETDLQNLKISLKKSEISMKALQNTQDLLGVTVSEEGMSSSMDQRERLLGVTQKMQKNSDDLDHAISLTVETIQVGADVMVNLDEQKTVMQNIIEKTRGINEQLGKAGRIMKVMGRRAYQNKFIMFIIILVLIGSISLVIYFKWIAK